MTTPESPHARHKLRMLRFWRRLELGLMWFAFALIALAFATGVAHWIIAIREWWGL